MSVLSITELAPSSPHPPASPICNTAHQWRPGHINPNFHAKPQHGPIPVLHMKLTNHTYSLPKDLAVSLSKISFLSFFIVAKLAIGLGSKNVNKFLPLHVKHGICLQISWFLKHNCNFTYLKSTTK